MFRSALPSWILYSVSTALSAAVFLERVRAFEDGRDVYARLGGRVSDETGKTIEGFQIPKLHIPRHLPDYVRWTGSLDGSTTETSERLLIL